MTENNSNAVVYKDYPDLVILKNEEHDRLLNVARNHAQKNQVSMSLLNGWGM